MILKGERGMEFANKKFENIVELIKEVKLNNEEASEELINVFSPYIEKYSRESFLNGYEREDFMQMGYMYLFLIVGKVDLNKFQGFEEDRIIGYLVKSLRNYYYMDIRKNAKYSVEQAFDIDEEFNVSRIETMRDGFSVEEHVIEKQERTYLFNEIRNLNNEERNLIVSYYFLRESIKEYAERNNCSYHVCRRRKKKVLEKMKASLKKEV